jgi:hypothetical protein
LETKVGKVVGALRKHQDKEIGKLSKAVRKLWMQAVAAETKDDQANGSAAGGSATTTTTSQPAKVQTPEPAAADAKASDKQIATKDKLPSTSAEASVADVADASAPAVADVDAKGVAAGSESVDSKDPVSAQPTDPVESTSATAADQKA